jgi:AcrR family transcriptional regulator
MIGAAVNKFCVDRYIIPAAAENPFAGRALAGSLRLSSGPKSVMYRSMQNSGQHTIAEETAPTGPEAGDGNEPSRGRGRPRAFDREAALSKAMRLFWQKGFEATSISDLRQAMGINSPSLYAAFGSKEALFAEAIRYYVDTFGSAAWSGFRSAATVREAVEAYMLSSASALSGERCDFPLGCMVTLSSVAEEGHEALGRLVRSERAALLDGVEGRLCRAKEKGEVPASIDSHALARFVQAVQSGMSILARDGASREELEQVVRIAMAGWDCQMAGRSR